MLKKTFLLAVTISSCMVLMPSLPESEDDSSFIGFNANNFAIGPNHPDIQKIERRSFINKIEKLESACVEALKKNPALEQEIKEVFIQKYTPLRREYSAHLSESDKKQYDQAIIWQNIQHAFFNPEQPKEIVEMKDDSCCSMQ